MCAEETLFHASFSEALRRRWKVGKLDSERKKKRETASKEPQNPGTGPQNRNPTESFYHAFSLCL